jgi:formate dehydrogenase subunit gamma
MEVVERYSPPARWFHWLIVAIFLELALSGLLLFLPWLSSGMVGTAIRLIHRVGAVLLVASPVVYALARPDKAWHFVKEALIWRKEDLAWVKAAPGYYFGGDPRLMPPQGHSNTGMRLYRLSIFFGAAVFIITGFIMWFLKGIVSPDVFQWCVVLHDITFIVAILFFLLHVQLAVFHPRMDESLLSMVDGKVSGVYAKSHHGKWYDKITKKNKGSSTTSS